MDARQTEREVDAGMILDDGVCTIIWAENSAGPGCLPTLRDSGVRFASYYKELSFETSPAYPTANRLEQRADARVRIHQCREIREDDVAELRRYAGGEATRYRITRAYHGVDEESGEPITDLTLREVPA